MYTIFRYLSQIFYLSFFLNIAATTLWVIMLCGNLRDLHISYGTTCLCNFP